MNLAIDIGNTLIKIGVFNADELLVVSSISTIDEINEIIEKWHIKKIIVSTVRKDIEKDLKKIDKKLPLHLLNNQSELPIINHYLTPDTLGVDRIAAIVGAKTLYQENACLVIDAGTCITYDFIDHENNYWGGSISPGLNMRLKALNYFTSGLPLIQIEDFSRYYGRDTKEAILSGVINGTLAEIEGFINKYAENNKNFTTIITGGDTKFFENRLKQSIFAVPNLVLIGLNRILQKNVQQT